MINTELQYKKIGVDDKLFYNRFYSAQPLPNSDYCFSVVQTWLAYGGEVTGAPLADRLLLLKYVDVLDKDEPQHNYTLIGDPQDIRHEHIQELINLARIPHAKVIVTQSHKEAVEQFLPESWRLDEEQGLKDYVYSVAGYAALDSPEYRRIRREISIFKRDNSEHVTIEDLDLNVWTNKEFLVNNHHTWDKTFQYENDPDRTEGVIMQETLLRSDKLGVRCVVIKVDGRAEGFMIYTEVQAGGKLYADVHHARFSYRYKHLNDLAFHLFAKLIASREYDYINFERDADIPGLRVHKQMLKPVFTITAYNLQEHKL